MADVSLEEFIKNPVQYNQVHLQGDTILPLSFIQHLKERMAPIHITYEVYTSEFYEVILKALIGAQSKAPIAFTLRIGESAFPREGIDHKLIVETLGKRLAPISIRIEIAKKWVGASLISSIFLGILQENKKLQKFHFIQTQMLSMRGESISVGADWNILINHPSLQELHLDFGHQNDGNNLAFMGMGFTVLSQALLQNKTITSFAWGCGKAGKGYIDALLDLLEKNQTIRFLDLDYEWESDTARQPGGEIAFGELSEALQNNKTLRSLSVPVPAHDFQNPGDKVVQDFLYRISKTSIPIVKLNFTRNHMENLLLLAPTLYGLATDIQRSQSVRAWAMKMPSFTPNQTHAVVITGIVEACLNAVRVNKKIVFLEVGFFEPSLYAGQMTEEKLFSLKDKVEALKAAIRENTEKSSLRQDCMRQLSLAAMSGRAQGVNRLPPHIQAELQAFSASTSASVSFANQVDSSSSSTAQNKCTIS